MVNKAWNCVSKETIANCWRHCDILGNSPEPRKPIKPHIEEMLKNFDNLFDRLSYFCHPDDKSFSPAQLKELFLTYEEGVPTGELLSDDDIVEMVKDSPDEDEDPETETEQPKIDYNEAQNAINILKKYFQQSDELIQQHFDALDNVQLNLESVSETRKIQSKLNFFKPCF
jgi:hypothetical protein